MVLEKHADENNTTAPDNTGELWVFYSGGTQWRRMLTALHIAGIRYYIPRLLPSWRVFKSWLLLGCPLYTPFFSVAKKPVREAPKVRDEEKVLVGTERIVRKLAPALMADNNKSILALAHTILNHHLYRWERKMFALALKDIRARLSISNNNNTGHNSNSVTGLKYINGTPNISYADIVLVDALHVAYNNGIMTETEVHDFLDVHVWANEVCLRHFPPKFVKRRSVFFLGGTYDTDTDNDTIGSGNDANK